jgi:hypothetical protein
VDVVTDRSFSPVPPGMSSDRRSACVNGDDLHLRHLLEGIDRIESYFS